MDWMEVIRTRKSVRTFDGRPLSLEDKEKLCSYIETITNPYGIPMKFVWLDPEKHGLSSPVIAGETVYIAAKVPKIEYCEEAFGYSFEKMVLYAWSIGIGTTWIGGTMKREMFEKAAGTSDDEFMMIVSPLGYPAVKRSEVDSKLRNSVHGDDRFPANELFFDGDFSTPLADEKEKELLESVRWAPSAANMQPCRVVVTDGNKYHFYENHTKGYKSSISKWDIQKIDVGIALCHFMSVTDGKFDISDPGIAVGEDREYIATVTV
ncbi:MAG: nitroreductase family protein [Pyramidobacter sp.]|uniref:nitroreductase family protein n=1 Tax=Pyramidobacter sp. TaxID=1943581 RepID=UPI002A7EC2D9|nr:nitroreductase family protein [Pyramidobacter sp.]MDY4033659.1 nitroreductase family protein [Pyramidobacter sp.]